MLVLRIQNTRNFDTIYNDKDTQIMMTRIHSKVIMACSTTNHFDTPWPHSKASFKKVFQFTRYNSQNVHVGYEIYAIVNQISL